MRLKIKHITLLVFVLTILVFNNSCLESYNFKSEVKEFDSALVVEGTITNNTTTQRIMLSRSYSLDSVNPIAESHALIKVIDDFNNEFLFYESSPGEYISATEFAAQKGREYILDIETGNGKKYRSNPIALREPAEIERVYAERGFNNEGEEGVFIYVDAYSPSGNSNYYRYSYEETYKIVAPRWVIKDLDVISEVLPFEVQFKNKEEEQRVCYGTNESYEINIQETFGLDEDKLTRYPVRFVNRKNYSLTHRYSILVKQYVLSREAYTFYTALKTIAGSKKIFSQNQPGTLISNVYSLENENESVLGFFNVVSVSSKRIFFNYTDFFPEEQLPDYPVNCSTYSFIAPEMQTIGIPATSPLIDQLLFGYKYYSSNYDIGQFGLGPYILVPPECGDCRTLGSNVTPDFWID